MIIVNQMHARIGMGMLKGLESKQNKLQDVLWCTRLKLVPYYVQEYLKA